MLETYGQSKAETEIEALKKENKKLKAELKEQNVVFSSMSESVVFVDSKDRVKYINPAAIKFLTPKVPKILGADIDDVILDHEVLSLYNEVKDTHQPIDEEIDYFKEKKVSFILNITPIIHRDKLKGLVLVFNDISRIKQLEKYRRDFVSNVSHELRTPLTSIQGFVETLQNDSFTDTTMRSEFLDIILKQTKRLNTLINDLLSLSQIEYRSSKIKFEKTKISDVIGASVDMCLAHANEAKVKLTFHCESSESLDLSENLFMQSIINLIENAINYRKKDCEDNFVHIQCFSKAGHLFITVEDSGIGIGGEHLKRVFERFYRVDKSRSRESGGTGLGLALVKHIVELQGGTIQLQSELGVGSKFTMAFPLSPL